MLRDVSIPRLVAPLVMIAFITCATARAEDWPQWRGPRGDGTSVESNIPVRWSATENVRWKTPIPGKGHSSPVVWGDQIFLTTCLEGDQERMLLCLDRVSGKILWQNEVLKSPLEKKHKLNSYASATRQRMESMSGWHFFRRRRSNWSVMTLTGSKSGENLRANFTPSMAFVVRPFCTRTW